MQWWKLRADSVLLSLSKLTFKSVRESTLLCSCKIPFSLSSNFRSTTHGKLAEGGVVDWAEDGVVQHTPQKGDCPVWMEKKRRGGGKKENDTKSRPFEQSKC